MMTENKPTPATIKEIDRDLLNIGINEDTILDEPKINPYSKKQLKQLQENDDDK
jgi:hypothetical protein